MPDKPAGVHARGGDTKKQNALGFHHDIDFRGGIERALNSYDAAAPAHPLPVRA